MRGWALDRRAPLAEIAVYVNGVTCATAKTGVPRMDVADKFPDVAHAYRGGWQAMVDLAAFDPGPIDIEVVGRRKRGRRVRLGRRTVEILPAGPGEGMVDWPSDGTAIEPGAVYVSGWARATAGAIARVRLTVDDEPIALARLGLPTPRLRSAGPAGIISGFGHLLDLSDAAPGSEIHIGGIATTTDGASFVVDGPTIVVKAPDAMSDAESNRIARLHERSRRILSWRGRADDAIKLVAFTHSLGYGGGQLYLWELLRLLRKVPGFSCTLVSPQDGPLRRDFEEIGMPVHIAGAYPTEPEAYEGRVAELGAWVATQGFNMAMANTMGTFLGVDVACRAGVPVLWAVHESFTLATYITAGFGGLPRYTAHRLAVALGAASAVIFEADATRQAYAQFGDPERFITVPYGIPIDAIDRFRADFDAAAARRDLWIEDGSTVLLCLGTIEPRKNQTVLAQAFHMISGRHPDAELVFIGDGGGQYSDALRSFVAEAGLSSRTRILPVTADTYRWYGAADALVTASDVESLPRSMLEAMAFELPVLSTGVFGIPELIADGRNGILCGACDLDALADGLDRLLTMSADARRAIALEGARTVRAGYDSRGYAEAYRALMEAMVADPRAHPAEVFARR